MITLAAVSDWLRKPGALTSWDPTPATLERVREAPVSDVPASYQQAQHLRSYHEQHANGLDFARLVIPVFDVAGQCDTRTMTYVINAHLRRHDTYHSWFEYTDAGDVVRHTVADPATIALKPIKHGQRTAAELQAYILDTPDPLQWNCFRFGIIQRADHFSFFASVDHVHNDLTLLNAVFVEIISMYTALVEGDSPIPVPEPAPYTGYCLRQRDFSAALTVDSPAVRTWIEFAEHNGGTLPRFPLPLGDTSVPHGGTLLTVHLMDARQTDRFEAACVEAGARFSGGVWACAALATHQLTGASTFSLVTPTDTRAPEELNTTGWCTGLIPITIPVPGATFADTVRAAQASFDVGVDVANVQFDRVVELAPWLRRPEPGMLMLSFLDSGAAPLSPVIMAQCEAMNGGFCGDGRYSPQLNMWVNRLGGETRLAMAIPDNPIALASITQFLDALKSVYVRVADGRGAAESFASPASICR